MELFHTILAIIALILISAVVSSAEFHWRVRVN